MESAAVLAKELGRWNEVSDYYRKASELYIECGRSQPASDALAKCARCVYAILKYPLTKNSNKLIHLIFSKRNMLYSKEL